MIKQKLKVLIQVIMQFVINPHFLLCFGLAWLITNGWAYILLGIGTYYNIAWTVTIAGGYLAFLWLPVSPEKIVTIAITIALLRILFPNDKKTLAVLQKAKDVLKDPVKHRRKSTATE